jgi:type II secretory pathway predicted ATPase ExeA
MMKDRSEPASGQRPRFTAAQEAAIAKLAYAVGHAGAVALVCGPAGVGKTTLLEHVAAVGLPTVRTVQLCGGRDSRPPLADVVLVDDADLFDAADLVGLVESWRRLQPRLVIVLAGQGRLLSVCGGDRRLEQLVRLRVVLPTFTLEETRELIRPLLRMPEAGADGPGLGDDVLDTLHEIAAGVPAVALRLADMLGVLAAADPGRRLRPDDVEAIHRRLCLHAA